MKAKWGSGGIALAFLTLALHGGVVTFTIRHFTPRERVSSNHQTGGSVEPTAHLNTKVEKNLFPLLGITVNPGPAAHSLTPSHNHHHS
jgi:hypothetical protein